MTDNKKKPIIFVTGDVCIDWNIAGNFPIESNAHNLWKSEDEWLTSNPEGGSSWLLKKIIEKVCNDKAKVKGRQNKKKYTADNIDHLYTIYQRYPLKKDSDKKVWRTKKYLGWQKRENKDPFTEDILKPEHNNIKGGSRLAPPVVLCLAWPILIGMACQTI